VNQPSPPLSERAFEYALAKAVRRGDLKIVKSSDGGALYGLASYIDANPTLVNSLQRAPLRSLQWQGKERHARAVRRWQDLAARSGTHDLRPGHKCIACGYVVHRGPDWLSPDGYPAWLTRHS